jgi:hypothetical protein
MKVKKGGDNDKDSEEDWYYCLCGTFHQMVAWGTGSFH